MSVTNSRKPVSNLCLHFCYHPNKVLLKAGTNKCKAIITHLPPPPPQKKKKEKKKGGGLCVCVWKDIIIQQLRGDKNEIKFCIHHSITQLAF